MPVIANAVSFDAFHCPWSVMAGLVPAFCRGRVPLEMAGTSPAMTERTRVAMEGHWFGPLVQIVELPRAAPLRPGLGKGVRCIVFGRHLIFYVVHVRVLEIRRVLHGARNISADDVN
jgi:plasmid stabilization system protein ParE